MIYTLTLSPSIDYYVLLDNLKIGKINRSKTEYLRVGGKGINVSKVYGVVTFYSFFTMVPKGEYVINICLGTACFVRGADKILERVEEILKIKNGETTADGKFTLTTLRCVGACGLAPVMQINDKTYGNVTVDDVERILMDY
jgi:NADH-quinone oxidoreductase subunit E/NADP-reducing hydrogenase subunit HndA